jgi:hypothetical protein
MIVASADHILSYYNFTVPKAEFPRPNWDLNFLFPALRPSVLQTGTTPNQAFKPAENDVFETCLLWMKTSVSVHSA